MRLGLCMVVREGVCHDMPNHFSLLKWTRLMKSGPGLSMAAEVSGLEEAEATV